MLKGRRRDRTICISVKRKFVWIVPLETDIPTDQDPIQKPIAVKNPPPAPRKEDMADRRQTIGKEKSSPLSRSRS